MKYILIFILILISYINSFPSENKITLYINNRPVDTEIFLLHDNKPAASAEILASELKLNYDSNSKVLYMGDKIFKGEKIVKGNIILIFLKDFAAFTELTYIYDEKARTIDLRNFNVRLQKNLEKNLTEKKTETSQAKTGDEVKILYERTEQGKENTFIVYATIQNISGSILDMVVVNCIFSYPAGQIINRQSISLNTMLPGSYREISFSIDKPPADPGAGEGGIFYGSVKTTGGGTYSSIGFSGGLMAAQQLVTPDYKLMIDYNVRNQ